MPDLSPAARDRAVNTVIAAAAFGDAVGPILGACSELTGEQTVVVAVVGAAGDGAPGLLLRGLHYVEQTELVEKVPQLEADSGWAMVFSKGTEATDIARRCEEMASIAEKRIAAMDRIAARREARPDATATDRPTATDGPTAAAEPTADSTGS